MPLNFHPNTTPLLTPAQATDPDDPLPVTDLLLSQFLTLWLEYTEAGRPRRSKEQIAAWLGRSVPSIHVMPWKIATNYWPALAPRFDGSREGYKWTPRDAEMVANARQGQGAAERGVDTAYIAGILGRTVNDVLAYEARLEKAKGGFGL